jgi:hypothetical protein
MLTDGGWWGKMKIHDRLDSNFLATDIMQENNDLLTIGAGTIKIYTRK